LDLLVYYSFNQPTRTILVPTCSVGEQCPA